MTSARRLAQSFARFAAGVMLLAALMPTAARALTFVQGQFAPFSVLCSAQRDARLPTMGATGATGETGDAGNLAARHGLDVCGLCLLAAHATPPASGQAPLAPPPAIQGDVGPRAERTAGVQRPLRLASRPRAPPHLG